VAVTCALMRMGMLGAVIVKVVVVMGMTVVVGVLMVVGVGVGNTVVGVLVGMGVGMGMAVAAHMVVINVHNIAPLGFFFYYTEKQAGCQSIAKASL